MSLEDSKNKKNYLKELVETCETIKNQYKNNLPNDDIEKSMKIKFLEELKRKIKTIFEGAESDSKFIVKFVCLTKKCTNSVCSHLRPGALLKKNYSTPKFSDGGNYENNWDDHIYKWGINYTSWCVMAQHFYLPDNDIFSNMQLELALKVFSTCKSVKYIEFRFFTIDDKEIFPMIERLGEDPKIGKKFKLCPYVPSKVQNTYINKYGRPTKDSFLEKFQTRTKCRVEFSIVG